jgi:hypothetical protein
MACIFRDTRLSVLWGEEEREREREECAVVTDTTIDGGVKD